MTRATLKAALDKAGSVKLSSVLVLLNNRDGYTYPGDQGKVYLCFEDTHGGLSAMEHRGCRTGHPYAALLREELPLIRDAFNRLTKPGATAPYRPKPLLVVSGIMGSIFHAKEQ
jgi:hypothetical protein